MDSMLKNNTYASLILRLYENKELIFTTQDFTFPSALQGSLKNSLVIDVNLKDLQIDLSKIKTETDGLLITNLFGHSTKISDYVNYCDINKKFLIFDTFIKKYMS